MDFHEEQDANVRDDETDLVTECIESDGYEVGPEVRSDIIERQFRTLRDITGSMQANLEKIEESDAEINEEFFDELWDFAGGLGLWLNEYVEQGEFKEDLIEE